MTIENTNVTASSVFTMLRALISVYFWPVIKVDEPNEHFNFFRLTFSNPKYQVMYKLGITREEIYSLTTFNRMARSIEDHFKAWLDAQSQEWLFSLQLSTFERFVFNTICQLESLGSPDEIAYFLAGEGCYGRPYAYECPISRYLARYNGHSVRVWRTIATFDDTDTRDSLHVHFGPNVTLFNRYLEQGRYPFLLPKGFQL